MAKLLVKLLGLLPYLYRCRSPCMTDTRHMALIVCPIAVNKIVLFNQLWVIVFITTAITHTLPYIRGRMGGREREDGRREGEGNRDERHSYLCPDLLYKFVIPEYFLDCMKQSISLNNVIPFLCRYKRNMVQCSNALFVSYFLHDQDQNRLFDM